MSIHKQDLLNTLKAYEALAAKGNNAAISLVPGLIHSLVRYVEEATGHKPVVDAVLNTAEPVVADVAVAAGNKIAADAKAFAVETATKLLKENGNVTIETDKGSLSAEIGDGVIPGAEQAGVDVAKEVATVLVTEAEKEGASEITAVTTTVTEDAEKAEEATKTKKAPAKK